MLSGVSADDTETLGMALSVSDDLMSPFNRDYHGCRSALRTWHSDAAALTQPKLGVHGFKTRPRWLVGEYTFLRFLWRSSQAAYLAGGPEVREGHPLLELFFFLSLCMHVFFVHTPQPCV